MKYMSSIELNVALRAAALGVGPLILSYKKICGTTKVKCCKFVPEDPLSAWETWKTRRITDGEWFEVQMEACNTTLEALKVELSDEQQNAIIEKVRLLLNNDIIHADLHTSNIMYKVGSNGVDLNKPYIIDYGWCVTKEDIECYPEIKEYWDAESYKANPRTLIAF